MNIFKEDKKYEKYMLDLNDVISSVKESGYDEDIKKLESIRTNFSKKVEDFFREGRKMNIAVVGQVKAGKSSFLNTLLFNGKEVLPKAATPKTATLTKMEYSDNNSIYIDYYSMEEWKALEENAEIDLDDDIYTSAREIMNMVKRSKIDVEKYLSKGEETINFDSYEDLIRNLNDYVGEDGKYTPIIKSVTLYLNNKDFEGLSIVDTPGLNDPIASRTLKTKEFVELCDVVFFLSQSGSFLDKSDWELLSTQLPQKGVKKLVLIASKYDSGIRDVLREKKIESGKLDKIDVFDVPDENSTDNIKDACNIIRKKLKGRAKSKIKEFTKEMEIRGFDENAIKVIQECSNPILISSICNNMSGKKKEEYTPEEKNIYNGLKRFSDDISEDLKFVGNFDEVRTIFNNVVNEKNVILNEKSKSFISNSKSELINTMNIFKEKSVKKINVLENGDKAKIEKGRRKIGGQIKNIKADIKGIYFDFYSKLEKEKLSGMKEIRKSLLEFNKMKERKGSENKEGYNEKRFLIFFKRKERYTYEASYSYYRAEDVIENLRNFAIDACISLESVFEEAIKVKEIKRKILDVVVKNFDLGDENYDSAFIKLLVEETVSNMDLPVFKVNLSGSIESITNNFNGEIRNEKDKGALVIAFENSMATIYEELESKFLDSVEAYKKDLNSKLNKFEEDLLERLNKEYESLLSKFEDKEKEISKYNSYIEVIDKNIKQIK